MLHNMLQHFLPEPQHMAPLLQIRLSGSKDIDLEYSNVRTSISNFSQKNS